MGGRNARFCSDATLWRSRSETGVIATHAEPARPTGAAGGIPRISWSYVISLRAVQEGQLNGRFACPAATIPIRAKFSTMLPVILHPRTGPVRRMAPPLSPVHRQARHHLPHPVEACP